MLDPLPQPVLMMKPLPSEEPAVPATPLLFKESGDASGGESGAGATGGGGDGGGDTDKPDKTDEELARALHEQLNT